MSKSLWMGLILLLGTVECHAIQVTPTYQIYTVKPGGKATGEYTVTNNDDEKITVTLTSKNWYVPPGSEAPKGDKLLTIDENVFPLMKGDSKKFHISVTAPKNVKGEMMTMLSLSFVGEDVTSNVQKVLSLAVYVGIAGTEKLKGELKAVSVLPSTHTVDVGVMITNSGNVHIRPTGWFEILNEKGKQVANIPINQGRPVFPGKDGNYSGRAEQFDLKPGFYKAHISVSDVDRQKMFINTTRRFEVMENNKVELR